MTVQSPPKARAAPMRVRPLLATLGLALLLGPSLAAPSASHAGPGSLAPDWTLLVADDPSGIPVATADEAEAILRESAGFLPSPRLLFSTRAELADALLAVRTPRLLLFAHGEPEGLTLRDGVLPWADLGTLLATTDARVLHVGACFAESIPNVPGKTIHRAFPGEVDHRYAAAKVALDTLREDREGLFEAVQDDYESAIETRGGFARYAQLLLAPEVPLRICPQKFANWNSGMTGEPIDVSGLGCLHYSNGRTPNCNSDLIRKVDVRCEYAAERAKSYRDTVQVTTAGQTSDWDAFWERVDVRPARRGDDLVIEIVPKNELCVDTLQIFLDAVSGGGQEVLRGLLKAQAVQALRSFSPVWVEPNLWLGVQVCAASELTVAGYYSHVTPQTNIDGSLTFSIKYGFEASIKVVVLHFPEQEIGAKYYLSYPFTFRFQGRIAMCSSNPVTHNPNGHIAWNLDVGSRSGPLTMTHQYLFLFGVWGRPESLGYESYDTAHPLERRCAQGYDIVADARRGETRTQSSPRPLPSTLDDLVQSGLATIDPDPAPTGSLASLVVVRPGTPQYEQLRESGSLERLGISSALPPNTKVVLDASNPEVQRELGVQVGGPSAVHLTAPAIELAAGVPVSSAEEICLDQRRFLGTEERSVAIAAGCAWIDPANPERSRLPGIAVEVNALRRPGLSDAEQATLDAALSTGRRLALEACPSFGATDAGCRDANRIGSATFRTADLELLHDLHDANQLLGRFGLDYVVLTPCRALVEGDGEAQEEPALVAVGGVCPDVKGVPTVYTPELLHEIRSGYAMLEDYALGMPLAYMQAVGEIETADGMHPDRLVCEASNDAARLLGEDGYPCSGG